MTFIPPKKLGRRVSIKLELELELESFGALCFLPLGSSRSIGKPLEFDGATADSDPSALCEIHFVAVLAGASAPKPRANGRLTQMRVC